MRLRRHLQSVTYWDFPFIGRDSAQIISLTDKIGGKSVNEALTYAEHMLANSVSCQGAKVKREEISAVKSQFNKEIEEK